MKGNSVMYVNIKYVLMGNTGLNVDSKLACCCLFWGVSLAFQHIQEPLQRPLEMQNNGLINALEIWVNMYIYSQIKKYCLLIF